MAKIDAAYAQRMEQSRRDMLTRHDPETVAGLMNAAARMWRSERQIIETRVRNALQEMTA
ncbi:hypothetical protein [Paracoccus liaowanqingii]|nr:hypothetical protein [Paracoccus liaowanqingii]